MTREELEQALEQHKLWLEDKTKGCQADLRRADLCRADLRRADLRWADLREADLRWADLREADLLGANLRGANLRWADLSEANLLGANLRGANLRWAAQDFAVRIDGLCWDVCLYADGRVQIGCETHAAQEWAAFDDERINSMDREALAFWRVNRDWLLATAKMLQTGEQETS